MAFSYEEHPSTSPYVEAVWSSNDLSHGNYLSAADACWDLIVVHPRDGVTKVLLSGPSSRVHSFRYSAGSRNLGLRFRVGVLVRHDGTSMLDRSVWLSVRGTRFLIGDRWMPAPETRDEALALADELDRQHLLERPAVAAQARTRQRRIRSAVGLSSRSIAPITRARSAANQLAGGAAILDVVHDLGYADQAHLTRDLKRFTGFTPGGAAARREHV